MEYKYSAFISYKHLDKKYAIWIQQKLEKFRLPTKICSEHNLPKRLHPCFRDVTDLTGGVLEDAIIREMEQCKYMILICSPNMYNNSKYIDFEVEAFRRIHGDEYIIPFIVDGEIGIDETKNPFPEIIKSSQTEYLGINVGQDGKKIALLKVIAKILGLSADDLIAREKTRQLKKKVTISAICSLFLCAFIGTWLYTKPYENEYSDYILLNNEPKGIYELTDSQLKTETSYYVLTTQMGKTTELKYVNTNGSLKDNSYNMQESRPTKAIYEYSNGMVSTVDYYDEYDEEIYTLQFSAGSIATAFCQDDVNPSDPFHISSNIENAFSDISGSSVQSNITGYSYEYNENGNIIKQLFLRNNEGYLACTSELIYGFEFVYDDEGRIIEKYFLNGIEEHMSDENGVYSIKYTYDNGKLGSVSYIAENGSAILNNDGFAVLEYEYDDNYRISNYYDENNNLINISKGNEYATAYTYFEAAIIEESFDLNDNYSNINFYDYQGELVANVIQEYNQQGLCISQEYFDENGNEISNNNYQKREYTYYENGMVETISLTPPDVIESKNDNQYFLIEFLYDENWNLIRTSYFDINGELVVYGDEFYNYGDTFAVEENIYEDSKLIRTNYYDQNMNLMINKYKGYAAVEYEYDISSSNPTKFTFYNEYEETDNIQIYVQTFEEKMEMYEKVGIDIVNIDGFDELLEEIIAEEKSEAEKINVAIIEIKYTNGYASQISFYDKDGENTIYAEGFHKTVIEKEFRADAKLEEIITYYDTNEYKQSDNRKLYGYTGILETETYIQYEDNKESSEIICYYDESGNVTKKENYYYNEYSDKILSSYYIYDEYEREIFIGSTYEDETYGSLNITMEYTYYNNDSIKTKIYKSETIDGVAVFDSITEYFEVQEPGLVNGYMGSMYKLDTVTYVDGMPSLYEYKTYDINSELLWYSNIYYSDSGKKEQEIEKTYATETEPEVYIMREYDENEILISEGYRITQADGSSKFEVNTYIDGELVMEYVTNYDADGNIIENEE